MKHTSVFTVARYCEGEYEHREEAFLSEEDAREFTRALNQHIEDEDSWWYINRFSLVVGVPELKTFFFADVQIRLSDVEAVDSITKAVQFIQPFDYVNQDLAELKQSVSLTIYPGKEPRGYISARGFADEVTLATIITEAYTRIRELLPAYRRNSHIYYSPVRLNPEDFSEIKEEIPKVTFENLHFSTEEKAGSL